MCLHAEGTNLPDAVATFLQIWWENWPPSRGKNSFFITFSLFYHKDGNVGQSTTF